MKANNIFNFLYRHVGLNDSDIKIMLNRLDIESLDCLIEKVIPKNILSPITENLLENDLSETETLARLKKYSKQNKLYKSFIGMGYYGTLVSHTYK